MTIPPFAPSWCLLLAKAGGWQGMALGQALDLSPERQGFSASDIATMQALKTGALFRFACEAGAVLGRAAPAERAALVGLCVRLRPGLPARRRSARCRKATPQRSARRWPRTQARGKATLVALLGPEAAKARLAALVAEAESALAPFGAKAATLIEAARFVAERRA